MRLDVYLAENGLCRSRSRAAELIRKGAVSVNGRTAEKPSAEIPAGALVAVAEDPGFVGRGGEKLEAAVQAFGVDVSGKVCADLGASTGGFTDCLLRHGATKVYAVDVGRDQLDPTLAADGRVVNMQGVNIRYMDPAAVGKVGLVTADLSFISLKYIFPVVKQLLLPDARAVCLVKPQFEAGREHIGKNGVVKDPKTHLAVLREVIASARENGLYPLGLIESPIKGGDGNTEFLLFLSGQAREEREIYPERVIR